MSDRSVRGTTLYRALRALNSDLEASDVLEMARENIERKWAVIQAEREAVETAEREAEKQAEREAEEQEARATLDAIMGDTPPGLPNLTPTELLNIVQSSLADDVRRNEGGPVLEILQRLIQWMDAAGGGAYQPDDRIWNYGSFSISDVSRLLGCSYVTVTNWLNGNTYRPHDYHLIHLEAMMEDHSYAQLRRMLQHGQRISC